MSGFRAFFRRLFHGPAFTALLERCGIDVRRFWLLADLFETLGARQEVVGMDDYSMRGLMNIWFVLSAGISVLAVATGAQPDLYLAGFLALTVLQLGVLLLPEIAESLVNPVDGLILAHQPVDGATWSAAKLAHLTRIVVNTVTGLNAVPALVGLALPHDDGSSRLVYPLLHFLLGLGVGLVFALLCCSLFGWLVRIVPIRRLKAAAAMVQGLPMLAIYGFYVRDALWEVVSGWIAWFEIPAGRLAAVAGTVPGGPATVFGAVSLVLATVAGVVGLRAFSRDHLIRVAGLMSAGGGRRRRRWRWSNPGPLMAGLAGGQAGRAGFEYVRAAIVRDWQFRRNMALNLGAPAAVFLFVLVFGRDVSPFGPDFAIAHLLPHLFGMTAIYVCLFLAYGNDYKGIWCFAIAPDSAWGPFARGIHATLWLLLVVAPHAGWLLLLAWSWGTRDAVLFIAFSAAVATFYLGVGLRLIDGVPFGKQTPPTRSAKLMMVMLGYMIAMVVATAIQYMLFRSVAAVVVVTLVVGLGAYLVTRWTLTGFSARMLAGLRPATPGSMFGAVQDDAA